MQRETRPRIVLGFSMAAIVGFVMAEVSIAMAWSSATKFFVGLGVALVLGLVVPPLVLLPADILRHPRRAYLEGASARAQRQRRI
jgi:hypothetical protein